VSAAGERLTGALRNGADDYALILIATLDAADLNHWIEGLDGLTFLSYAARHRKHEIALALLLRGASIDARCKSGMTAIMWAAKSGGLAMVNLLLHHGARLDAEDSEGLKALDYVSCREIEGLFFAADRAVRAKGRRGLEHALYIAR
jgi:ankyrin repeat protein